MTYQITFETINDDSILRIIHARHKGYARAAIIDHYGGRIKPGTLEVKRIHY